MKKDVILFAATLAMMSLTSCSDSPDKPHVESSKPESSQTENTVIDFNKEFIRDTSEFNYIQGVSFTNNRIYVYGITDSEVEIDENFEFLDTKTNKTKKFNIDLERKSVDRYCIGPKGVYIFYADMNFESRLALADSKTGNIISDISQKELFSVTDMYNDSDGKLYVIKNVINTNPFNSCREYIADIYSDDLVLQKTFNLSQKLKLDEDEEICGIVSSDRSTFFMLTIRYDSEDNPILRIHKFPSDFSSDLTYDIKVEKDYELIPTCIFSGKSGQLYISSQYMQISQKLYLIDLENLTLLPDVVLENTLSVYQGTDDYDIVYRTNLDEEIYGYSFSDKKSTVLCDSNSHLDLDVSVRGKASSYESQILISTQNENVFSERLMISSDISGIDQKYIRISEEGFTGYTEKLYITDSGDIYCFYINDMIDDPSEFNTTDTEEVKKKYIVCHYDSSGKFVNSSDLTEYIGSGENIIVDTISSDSSGNIYVVYHTDGSLGLEMTFFLVCDSEGKKLMNEPLTGSCNCACIFNSGKSVIVAGNDAMELFEFDIKNGTLITSSLINTEIRPERIINIYAGQGIYDFYYADNRNIYGYVSDSERSEKIFSKEDTSDPLNDSDIQMFCPGGEKDVICTIFDDSDQTETEKIYILKRK